MKALHLPPVPWNGAKDGEFGALKLDDGSLGRSYVPLDDSLKDLAGGPAAENLGRADAMSLATRWRHGHPTRLLDTSAGMIDRRQLPI